MRKIFTFASALGFTLAHTHVHHEHSETKNVQVYPPVAFPLNAKVEYREQQLNLDTMMAHASATGYTVVSFYDYNNGRLLDQFGNPAYNTFFRDGKNMKFYQTVPGSDDFCADEEELPEGTDVKHEIMFKFHPDGGAVTYLGLTKPGWDQETEYYTFQNKNDQYKYFYSIDTFEPMWKADSKKLFSMKATGATFTDKDFFPFVCELDE